MNSYIDVSLAHSPFQKKCFPKRNRLDSVETIAKLVKTLDH